MVHSLVLCITSPGELIGFDDGSLEITAVLVTAYFRTYASLLFSNLQTADSERVFVTRRRASLECESMTDILDCGEYPSISVILQATTEQPTEPDSSAIFLAGFEVKLREADGSKILEKTICA